MVAAVRNLRGPVRRQLDGQLFGRRTWQTMADAWPDRAVRPNERAPQVLSARLVDELLLMIEPVLLGGGKSPFPGAAEMVALDLISVESTPSGVLVCTYRPGEIPPMPDFGEG